jgi:predicted alpha/beta hydrolase
VDAQTDGQRRRRRRRRRWRRRFNVGGELVLTNPPATLWSRVLSAVLMGMMSCGMTGRIFCPPALRQGLTLVHSSAQLKRLLCDRGCG